MPDSLLFVPKYRPFRSRIYLAWIRLRNCHIKGCKEKAEAAHTGDHGLSSKADDSRAIPLCEGHHRTRNDSYHALGRDVWESHWGLDTREIVIGLLTRFLDEEVGAGDDNAAA